MSATCVDRVDDYRHRVPRPDDRLRPLPRPQVRPDHAEGVLLSSSRSSTTSTAPPWTATPPCRRRWSRSPTPEQAAALAKLDEKARRLQKKIADEAAKVELRRPSRRQDGRGAAGAGRFRLDRRRPAAGRQAVARAASTSLELRRRPGPSRIQRQQVAACRRRPGWASTSSPAPSPACGAAPATGCSPTSTSIRPTRRRKSCSSGTPATGSTAPTGARTSSTWARTRSTERVHLGPLPEAGRMGAAGSGRRQGGHQAGPVINGWAFTQFGGTVYWDKAGIVTQTPQGEQYFDTLTAWLRTQKAAGGAGLPKDDPGYRQARPGEAQRRAEEAAARLFPRARLRQDARPRSRRCTQQLAALEKERGRARQADAGDAGLQGASGPQAGVHPQARRVRPAAATRSAATRRRFLPPLPTGRAAQPPRPGALAGRAGASADGPRRGQSLLAAVSSAPASSRRRRISARRANRRAIPNLLDWLAVQFREDGWDVKKTMKRLVTSATYRQSSQADEGPAGEGPGQSAAVARPALPPRRRDAARPGAGGQRPAGREDRRPERQAAAAGRAVGGGRLFSGSNTVHFVADTGNEKVHRRSMYTFWKRTSPPPQMSTLDAPSRESCMVRRERTNTPLQALLLLNDPQYCRVRPGAGRAGHEARAAPTPEDAHRLPVPPGDGPQAGREGDGRTARQRTRTSWPTYTRDVEAAKKLIAVGEIEAGRQAESERAGGVDDDRQFDPESR